MIIHLTKSITDIQGRFFKTVLKNREKLPKPLA